GLELALALEHRAERFAVDELHDEIGLAFVVADEVDLDDVRIVQRRHRTRLAQEALLDRGVVRQRLGQYLDRDVTVQRRLVALVNHAHAAAAEFRDDVVVSELGFHTDSAAPERRLTGAADTITAGLCTPCSAWLRRRQWSAALA